MFTSRGIKSTARGKKKCPGGKWPNKLNTALQLFMFTCLVIFYFKYHEITTTFSKTAKKDGFADANSDTKQESHSLSKTHS